MGNLWVISTSAVLNVMKSELLDERDGDGNPLGDFYLCST